VARFEVERALDHAELGTPEGRDRALAQVAPVIGRLRAGLLQDDLVRLISGRLGMSESLVNDALLRAGRSARDGRTLHATARGGVAAAASRERGGTGTADEDEERKFLARCLAVKSAGRRALDEMDLDASFSSDLIRRAAQYLAEHLDTPGQSLPPDDDQLAKLVAGLVIDSGGLESDPEALALERLVLDRRRIERQIAAARIAGELPPDLAREKQRVQAEYDRLQLAFLTRRYDAS
jgi:hypothetical protein